MDEALKRAYEASIYSARVDEGDVRIKIGAVSAELERALERNGVKTWAYVTAWNPQGKTLPPDLNEQRQEQLRTALARGGFEYAEGESEPADPNEMPECSVLVFGISEKDAVGLAREFDQLAIVAGKAGQPAKLIEVQSEPSDN
jgi:hypothetical protein